MWLHVPEEITNPLWEGQMAVVGQVPPGQMTVPEEKRRFMARSEAPRSSEGAAADSEIEMPFFRQRHINSGDLPIISIGQPAYWRIRDLYSPKKMDPILREQLKEANFYLSRLACSFRTPDANTRIERADFMIDLLPDNKGGQPIAFDLYPLQVTQDVKHSVKVTVTPKLKFTDAVEVDPFGAEFGFEYTELQPTITASGGGETRPSWCYQEAKGQRVQGCKWMHLLIKAPKGMRSVRAVLDLTAIVNVKGQSLPMLLRHPHGTEEKRGTRLEVLLWKPKAKV